MKTVLFLCTGNYYRSRFAELLFNDITQKKKLGWRAISRGIAQKITELRNPGPISQRALSALAELNIFPVQPIRFPKKATYEELKNAALLVALSRNEHEAMLLENYPEYKGTIVYWEIGDVHIESVQFAMERLHSNVRTLIEKLAEGGYTK